MKKALVNFMIGCMIIFMTSCSDNSPRSVAQQSVKCLMNKDFRGYVDLLNIPEDQKDLKEGYVRMLEEKEAKHPQSIDIESFEVIDEQVNEEAGTAKVTVKLINKKGKESKENIDLVKDDKGKWKVKSSK